MSPTIQEPVPAIAEYIDGSEQESYIPISADERTSVELLADFRPCCAMLRNQCYQHCVFGR